jgi:putative transposase
LTTKEKRKLIEKGNPKISVQRQCALLGQARSGYYYSPLGVSEKDLVLMRLLDEVYTRYPFYGSRRLRDWLCEKGYPIGRDHVRRLMRLLGIEAIYPKRRTSIPDSEHRVYPYLLNGLSIVRPNQVWAVDITYVRLLRGFCYLVAIMDWFSRYVLSWKVSVSLEVEFCLEALEDALCLGRPEIFNSDQGSQFTSEAFTNRLKDADIRISMDGKGRVFDNIMIERLWRSVKYEEVYLKDYEDVLVARESLGSYFPFYNELRRHQGLKGLTPLEAYKGLAKLGVAG